MKILLCLDPSTLNEELQLNRIPTFIKIANTLSRQGHDVTIYANIIHKKIFTFECINIEFLPASIEFENKLKDSDLNLSLFYINQAPIEIEQLMFKDISIYKCIPDVLISTAPTSVYRKIWPSALFLHYELGIFNREPFPLYHQFDPAGFHHKSILSKYLSYNLPINEEAVKKMENISEIMLNSLGLNKENIGSIDSLYVPLPSYKNWTVKSEISYSSRIEYLKSIANSNPNKQIICNEKPQHPLNEEEKKEISKMGNVKIIDNADLNGKGSLLCLICASTYTISPSISLQALFWGNKLYTHPDSSLYSWVNHPDGRNQLASYLDIFNILDFNDIENHIEQWQFFNPYKQIVM